MIRTATQIVRRAIVDGTLAFRASLEVTHHAWVVEFCSRLYPWLEGLGLGPILEPFHREILTTPHGNLPSDFASEAYWRGESAQLLGWSVWLFDMPDCIAPIDPGFLATNLRILRPQACELIANASRRPDNEIERFCALSLAVRHQFQLAVIQPDGRAVLEVIFRKRLHEYGLYDTFVNSPDLLQEAMLLASTTSNPRGVYVIRALTAGWLFGRDDRFSSGDFFRKNPSTKAPQITLKRLKGKSHEKE